jgi:hypothetical protein
VWCSCGTRNTWVPSYRPNQDGYDLERSSGSLGTGSGEGQSCGRPRARERKLVGEQARGQSTAGAAGACNHDASSVLQGHSSKIKVSISEVLSLVWLQLDDGLTSPVPRQVHVQAMRNASREKGFLFFIM